MTEVAKNSHDKRGDFQNKTASAQKVYGLHGKGYEHLSAWDFSLLNKIKKKIIKNLKNVEFEA